MEITSIASALAGIKTASDIVRLLKESSSSLKDAEIKMKLAELTNALADIKTEIADLKSGILDRDEKIRVLNDLLETKNFIIWSEPYYWLVKDEVKNGPFCQCCYDKDKKLIRVQRGGDGWHQCKV